MENKNENLLLKDEMDFLNEDLRGAINVLLEAGKKAELKNDSSESEFGHHEKVARKVFRRLLLRNAQLSLLTELTQRHFSNNQEIAEKITIILDREVQDKFEQDPEEQTKSEQDRNQNIELQESQEQDKSKLDSEEKNKSEQGKDEQNKENNNTNNNSELHVYKHAITDLFVEKALTYLEEKADYYSKFGRMAYYLGLAVIIGGIGISAFQYFHYTLHPDSYKYLAWGEIVTRFILAFTFYGFIVLAAVGLWRFGRAMLDQAERLLERRHALRQGRLFVHLHNGDLSIEEMEKAFNWNVNKPNAFGDMNTDAKAPWGAVVSEAIKGSTEVAKAAKNITDNYSSKTK